MEELNIVEAEAREADKALREILGEDWGVGDSNLLIEPLPTGWENLQFHDVCDRVKDSYEPIIGGSTPYIGLEHLAQGFPAFVGRGVRK